MHVNDDEYETLMDLFIEMKVNNGYIIHDDKSKEFDIAKKIEEENYIIIIKTESFTDDGNSNKKYHLSFFNEEKVNELKKEIKILEGNTLF